MNKIALMVVILAASFLPSAKCDAADAIAIEFTAAWCPHCRKIKPTIDKLIKDGLPIRKIDLDAQAGEIKGTGKSGRDLAAVYGVSTIPAMFVQVFDETGKPGKVSRIPLGNPAAIRDKLIQAGVRQTE